MRRFKIKEGKHGSGFHFGLNVSRRMVRYFKFDDSCISKYINSDSKDYNKLFGFSIGYHHHNSYRIVWRPSYEGKKLAGEGNLIELAGYQYNRSKRKFESLLTVTTGKIYKAEIFTIMTGTYYVIYDGDIEIGSCFIEGESPKFSFFGLGYKLWPYHGGQNKASHDMIIFLDKD